MAIGLATAGWGVTMASEQQDRLDAGPFGQVCTWDPRRTDGVRASRLEEIAADDLFLDAALMPDENGRYIVPRAADGRACVGLRWLEARPIEMLAIELEADPADSIAPPGPEDPGHPSDQGQPGPSPDAAPRVEFWQGATLWQGRWTAVEGTFEQTPRGWSFRPADAGRLAQKVRWILPAGGEPIVVRRLRAMTTSTMTTARIMVQRDPDHPEAAATIEMYNGHLVNEAGSMRRTWHTGSPVTLAVRYVTPRTARPDPSDPGRGAGTMPDPPTLIRFRLPDAAFAVAVHDVLERGPVYVPHAGLFVTAAPPEVSLDEYRAAIRDRGTILDEVRAMPDQTRERAMEITHYNRSIDTGRMMLSLACDNAKLVTEHDGTIIAYDDFSSDARTAAPTHVVTPLFGRRPRVSHTQGWALLGLDRAAHMDRVYGPPLRVGDRVFKRGLGTHAPSEIVIELDREYERFEAQVGVQWQGGRTPGSVVFEVLVDGESRFESGVVRELDEPRPVTVPLAGARELTLRVHDAGDGHICDAGNWLEARLIPPGDAPPVPLASFFRSTSEFERHLHGGWLPAPVVETRVGGVEYRQMTFVAPFREQASGGGPTDRPLGVVELTMSAPPGTTPADARTLLNFAPGAPGSRHVRITTAEGRSLVLLHDRVLGLLEHDGPLKVEVAPAGNGLVLSARLDPGQAVGTTLYLPVWAMKPDEAVGLKGTEDLLARFEAYWQDIIEQGTQFDLPDPWLTNVVRANLVHMLLAARNEEQGERVVPWIASDRYLGAIDSEGNSVVRGMMYFGHFDFARRAKEFYFSRYLPEGFMTTGYTLMGNGWHLWTLGEYVRLSGDLAWFETVADQAAGLCRWVIAQLDKTRRMGPDGNRVPEYGLMPPGVQADWDAYAYYFYANSYFRAGLAATGEALKAIGHPDAERILNAADMLREDIIRAYRRVQADAPVVPLRDGTWVPYYPSSVHTPGPMADFFPGQDANRSWCYDVELGAHHMIALGTMPPDEPDAAWILDHMEDVHFLAEGWGGYPAEQSRRAWFDMGGFAKVQPHYARNAEVYALRDDVRPFIRSYFNAMASLIDGTVLSLHEHFSNFVYNKTHETGYFLHQTRTMLLTERGDELWLAPFVPTAWLEDGRVVQVRDAPTFFGPVSYRITSHVADGRIEAMIEPPERSAPEAIVLRLRHPDGRPIRRVEVDGREHQAFEAAEGTVRLDPSTDALAVRVFY